MTPAQRPQCSTRARQVYINNNINNIHCREFVSRGPFLSDQSLLSTRLLVHQTIWVRNNLKFYGHTNKNRLIIWRWLNKIKTSAVTNAPCSHRCIYCTRCEMNWKMCCSLTSPLHFGRSFMSHSSSFPSSHFTKEIIQIDNLYLQNFISLCCKQWHPDILIDQ